MIDDGNGACDGDAANMLMLLIPLMLLILLMLQLPLMLDE